MIEDYKDFKELLSKDSIDCYIINTGAFLDKDITKEVTLGVIESIVEDTATFKPFGNDTGLAYLEVAGYEPPLDNEEYKVLLKERMTMRKDFLLSFNETNPTQPLPEETIIAINKIIGLI